MFRENLLKAAVGAQTPAKGKGKGKGQGKGKKSAVPVETCDNLYQFYQKVTLTDAPIAYGTFRDQYYIERFFFFVVVVIFEVW